jgi:predicted permease
MSEQLEPRWRRYLRLVRPNPGADLDDELRDHIESAVEELVARGMSADAARAEALRRFGDVARVRGEVRQLDEVHMQRVRRALSLETFLYDLRHGARALRRSPGFTIVAALSIALGVAANTTVFSAVNAVLLRPIPGTHADGLMRMYMNHHSPFDFRELAWFREQAGSLERVVGERNAAIGFRAAPGAESERVLMSYVTRGYFETLGVRMALGRPADADEAGALPDGATAVLSHAFWQRRFAGDSAIIGKTILLAERPVTVVGVTAPDFRSSVVTWSPNVFVPFAAAPILTRRRIDQFWGSFYTTVRLRPGLSAQMAGNQLRALMFRLARTDTARYEGRTVRLDHVRGVNAELRGSVAAGSIFLMAMVGLVLLIACANVANLLMGRAASRRTEIGVRMAIGAGRMRLVRQMLTESLLLAAIGSAAGLGGAWFLTRVMAAAIPPEAGLDAGYFSPDGRVLAFTALLCVLTTLLFGAVPALRAASPNLVGLLKGAATEARIRRRGWLVALQTAMCVLLLAVASVFLRSLASQRGVNPGFVHDQVVDVSIDLGLLGPGSDHVTTFAEIVRRATELPGVESAALTALVPLTGSNMETRVLPEGRTVSSRFEAPMAYFHVVGPRYFATLRIPLRRGREFSDTDREGAPRVAVISETAAQRLWPAGDALGQRFHWGGAEGELVEVVGIARDANYVMPGESPKTVVYMPFAQESRAEMVLQLRTNADLAATRRAVWDLVRKVAPGLPPAPVTRMTDDMAMTLLPVRWGAVLLGAFGALALMLAAAGIYGVASYSVARRTREIGIRAALGASRSRLVGMVLRESALRVGAGALAGFAATIAVSFALSRVLYGVEPLDPIVLLGTAAVIGVVALLASLVPAGRAARTDPISAIRTD